MIGIYKIINKVNGKAYIGQSISIQSRVREHFNGRTNKHLANAIRKYGEENFQVDILEDVTDKAPTQKTLDDLEIKYIGLENPDMLYNVESGGKARGLLPGRIVYSEEECRRRRQVRLGKKHSKSSIEKMSAIASKRGPRSEATRQKIREANLGKVVSLETRVKLSKAGKGRILSEEHKRKIGEAQKGKFVSEETREKISKSRKSMSEQTKSVWCKKVYCVELDREFSSIKKAAEYFETSISQISRVCKGKGLTVKKHHFKYIE